MQGVHRGADLTGGGSSGTVTLNADETKVQHRVTGTCGSGSAIGAIGQDGSVACSSTLAQMMAGSSSDLTGGTAYLAASGRSAPSGTEPAAEVGGSALPSTASNLWVTIATPTPIDPGPPTIVGWVITLDVTERQAISSVTPGPTCRCASIRRTRSRSRLAQHLTSACPPRGQGHPPRALSRSAGRINQRRRRRPNDSGTHGTSTTLPTLRRSPRIAWASGARSNGTASNTTG